MTEAERMATELTEDIAGFPEPTQLERRAASLLRKQAAEIEALRVSNDKLTSDLDAAMVDAARYQVVRKQGIEHEEETGIGMMTVLVSGDELDRVLDAAMSKEAK